MKHHPAYAILLIISSLMFMHTSGFAQMLEPVEWSTRVEVSGDGVTTLVAVANIEKGWHVYSQNIDDGGPIKTTFTFEPSADYTLEGKVEEGKATEFYDKNFEMQLRYFSNKAEFRQKVKLKNKEDITVKGSVEFMVCDDEKCLPPNDAVLIFEVKK